MSLNNDISKFDKLFEESFKNASAPAPSGAWEAIASQTTGAAAGTASTSIIAKLTGASLKIKAIVATVLVATAITSIVLLQPKEEVVAPSTQTNPQTVVVDDQLKSSSVNPNQAATTEIVSNQDNSNLNEKAVHTSPLPSAEGANGSSDKVNNPIIPPTNTPPVDFSTKGGQETGETKEIKQVQIQYELKAQRSVLCSNQSNEVWIYPPVLGKGSKTIWMLNGQVLTGNVATRSIASSQKGENVVSVQIHTADGQRINTELRFEVKGFDSDFASEFLQREQMYFVTSKTVANKHQWFENGNKLSAETANIRVQASDKTSTNLMHITENEGCRDTTIKVLRAPSKCDEEVEIPSVFTPYEKDNLNDEFVISGYHGVDAYTLLIYSSDGRRMFQAENSSQNWDGKDPQTGRLAPVGWYKYTLVVSCNGKSKKRYGKILLAG
ncbi:MAG: hypothetical protein ACI8ZN_000321 [Bacteroidia bacterium]